jgi:hypothetical protein
MVAGSAMGIERPFRAGAVCVVTLEAQAGSAGD